MLHMSIEEKWFIFIIFLSKVEFSENTEALPQVDVKSAATSHSHQYCHEYVSAR